MGYVLCTLLVQQREHFRRIYLNHNNHSGLAEVDGPWAISGRAFFAYLLPFFDEKKSRLVLKVA